MSGPLTFAQLQQVWQGATDPSYSDPLIAAGEGHGFEAVTQMLTQFTRVSQSIDTTMQSMFTLPWSGQTSPSAAGPSPATVALTFSYTSLQQSLLIVAGTLVEEAVEDWGPTGGITVYPGRRYATDANVVFVPGEAFATSPVTVGSTSEGPGYVYNEPLPGSITSIVQPGKDMTGYEATVLCSFSLSHTALPTDVYPFVPSVSIQCAPQADMFIPGSVGQYVSILAGLNLNALVLLSGFTTPVVSSYTPGVQTNAGAQIAGLTYDTGDTPSFSGTGSTGTVDNLFTIYCTVSSTSFHVGETVTFTTAGVVHGRATVVGTVTDSTLSNTVLVRVTQGAFFTNDTVTGLTFGGVATIVAHDCAAYGIALYNVTGTFAPPSVSPAYAGDSLVITGSGNGSLAAVQPTSYGVILWSFTQPTSIASGSVVTGSSGGSGQVTVVVCARLVPETLASSGGASWAMAGWASLLNVSATNAKQPTGGVTAMLDALGKEKALPRLPSENDATYAQRIATLADTVSPNAIRRMLNRMGATPWILREAGQASLPGFFLDLDFFDTEIIRVTPGNTAILVGDTVQHLGTGGVLKGTGIVTSSTASKLDVTITSGRWNVDFLPGDYVFDPSTAASTGTITSMVYLFPQFRWKVLLSWEQSRAFFLFETQPQSIGDYGFAFGPGGVGAGMATPGAAPFDAKLPLGNFYDGSPTGNTSWYLSLYNAINKIKAGGVGLAYLLTQPGETNP